MLDLLKNKMLALVTYFSKRRKYLHIAIRTKEGEKFLFSIPVKDEEKSVILADYLKKYKHIEIDCAIRDNL